MKQTIKFSVDIQMEELIRRWQDWLSATRRYSAHTLDAYSRDLSEFTNFAAQQKQHSLTIDDFQNFSIRTFRSFLAQRVHQHIEKSSIAREISSLKNFFKWMNKNKYIENTAISIISSPRQAKILPRALEVDDTFSFLEEALNFSKTAWQG